jgi:hypothetical protein
MDLKNSTYSEMMLLSHRPLEQIGVSGLRHAKLKITWIIRDKLGKLPSFFLKMIMFDYGQAIRKTEVDHK